MYAKRSGRLRSPTSSAVVIASNTRLSAGATVLKRLPHASEPAKAATRSAPAAMDFVHR
jgi:hypothetical protein